MYTCNCYIQLHSGVYIFAHVRRVTDIFFFPRSVCGNKGLIIPFISFIPGSPLKFMAHGARHSRSSLANDFSDVAHSHALTLSAEDEEEIILASALPGIRLLVLDHGARGRQTTRAATTDTHRQMGATLTYTTPYPLAREREPRDRRSPVVHLHELVFRHVQAVPQLASCLEGLLEVVHQLGGGPSRGRLLPLLIVLILQRHTIPPKKLKHEKNGLAKKGERALQEHARPTIGIYLERWKLQASFISLVDNSRQKLLSR